MNGPPFNAAANVADTHVVLINDELFIQVASFSHSSVNFCMSKWSSSVGLLLCELGINANSMHQVESSMDFIY